MATQKTRCPYCSSAFTVSSAQLAIRDGYVRCGKCFQVFKADDYLIPANNPQTEDKKSAYDQTQINPSKTHVDQINPRNSQGFDVALYSFMDKTVAPSTSAQSYKKPHIDLDSKTDTKSDTENVTKRQSTQSPKPLHSDNTVLSAAVKPTPDVPQSLGHELNEQWIKEIKNGYQGFAAQPAAKQSSSSENISAIPTTKGRPKKQPGVDDDLMNYLNTNSVPAARTTSLKTDRVVPSMNDFHANQRSKKNYSDLPMQYERQARNAALENLKKPKFQFKFNLPSVMTWLALSLLMVVLLAVQYVFFNFNQLAANPRYQPIMYKTCLHLGCDVPFIDINKININNAIGKRYTIGSTSATRFTATMSNSAAENQPYPYIRLLIIKDKKILSGRVLRPSEYLTNGYSSQNRLIPNRPIQIEFIIQIPRDQVPVFALDPIR